MFELSVKQVAKAIGAQLLGEDVLFHRVSIDSRQVENGDLFVALRGDRFDAHDFSESVLNSGAVALMVERPLDVAAPQLLVDDSRLALGRLAAYWRSLQTLSLLAITGSNGKTTVKEMLAAILSQVGSTHATQGNFNNEIGVPLTLLALQPEHQFAVVEMGANHAGEIAYLCSLAKPKVVLINNAAAAHLEGFGSLEGVARAKGEIYADLPEDGVALINVDDDFAPLWLSLANEHQKLTFGLQGAADVSGRWMAPSRLQIRYQAKLIELDLPLLGEHNARNAVAASAAALALGVGMTQIKRGLLSMRAVKGRMQQKQGINGSLLFDDSYNANLASLSVALNVICEQHGEPWLVLGDMLELGEESSAIHFQAGEQAKRAGVKRLFALGELSRHSCAGFGQGAEHFADLSVLSAALQSQLGKNNVLLIKGSRGMRLDKLVDQLVLKAGSYSGSIEDVF
ncbi:MAG: UDP-N-acetylmuramoyl-tripeptide--D-alanyl-D-alanine ligase [Gammaproteobacteria bacterium]|nr:UDP-N-acetylmuramoyl-tripeptide--D-alanyl-D-alanine ligase [Gammaproteobacteria bacterium]